MTRLFDRLQIDGYRGLENIDLPGLGRVNIFVGDNNSGKTSLLEAVAILCNPLDPLQWIKISNRRPYLGSFRAFYPDLESLKWVFSHKNISSESEFYQDKILIKATGSATIREMEANFSEIYSFGGSDSFEIEKNSPDKFSDPIDPMISSESDTVLAGIELDVITHLLEQRDLFPVDLEPKEEKFQFWAKERFIQRKRMKPFVKSATIFPSYASSEPILDRLSRLILREEGDKNEILELIRSFDDNIIDLQILSPANKTTLYINHKQLGLAPLYVFGDGFKRTLLMALNLLTTENGVILIDEIETSIHVSALSRVFSWLLEICRQREIQLFVTTHSLEAIDAMLRPETAIEDVVAFHLNTRGKPPQRFSGDLLHRLRWERGLDVR